MSKFSGLLLKALEDTLVAKYVAGGIMQLPVRADSGWLTRPDMVLARTDYTGELTFKDRTFSLHPGDAYCAPAGILNRRRLLGDRPGTTYWSHTRLTVLNGIDLFAFLQVPVIIKGPPAKQIGQLNTALAALTGQPGLSAKELLQKKLLLYDLFNTIAAISTERPDSLATLAKAERLEPAIACLSREPSETSDIQLLARTCHLSAHRFAVLFKEIFNESPGRYILNLRLRRAQRLLLSTSLSIGEIAAETGFNDVFHFSKIFKQKCGSSPRFYRAQAVQGEHVS